MSSISSPLLSQSMSGDILFNAAASNNLTSFTRLLSLKNGVVKMDREGFGVLHWAVFGLWEEGVKLAIAVSNYFPLFPYIYTRLPFISFAGTARWRLTVPSLSPPCAGGCRCQPTILRRIHASPRCSVYGPRPVRSPPLRCRS